MPLSFWIFLVVCILSFIPSALDHGETWKNFKSCNGCGKIKPALRLFGIWVIPFLFLIATLLSGYEGIRDTNEKKLQTDAVLGFSNQLNVAMHQINVQSNALAAAKIKPLKMRLIDCLNSINPQIIQYLKSGETRFTGSFESYKYSELEQFSQDPEGAKYISLHNDGGSGIMADGRTMRNAHFELNPELLK